MRVLERVHCPVAFLGFALTGFVLPALGQTPPREHFQNAEVIYDWVTNHRGEKLRTFVTRPKTSSVPVPAIFFVGWLSCDSMEYPDANTRDGFGIFMRRLIDGSGYAILRMDKPGVGESQASVGRLTSKAK